MVNRMENIPNSLYRPLSEKLVSVLLGSENISAVPKETTNKIIYLWRKDQLASTEGIEVLLKAGSIIDYLETLRILNDLELKKMKDYLRMIRVTQLNC